MILEKYHCLDCDGVLHFKYSLCEHSGMFIFMIIVVQIEKIKMQILLCSYNLHIKLTIA